MSERYRSSLEQRSRDPDPSRNYGLVIAVIGAGIVVVALAAMFITPLIRSELSAAEPEVTPVTWAPTASVATATPPAQPAGPATVTQPAVALPSPTAQPAVTPSPTPVPVDADESVYLASAIDTRDALSESFDRFIASLPEVQFNGEQHEQLEAELGLWETLHEELSAFSPPERHRASHETLLNGTSRFAEAAGLFRDSLDGSDPEKFAASLALLGDGVFYLNQHAVQLARE